MSIGLVMEMDKPSHLFIELDSHLLSWAFTTYNGGDTLIPLTEMM